MARQLTKSNIEQFVDSYLSKFRNANQKRAERATIEKAIKQIEFFLNPPCCIDPDAEITFSRKDNALTTYIAAIFSNKFDKRKYRKSLERTIDKLKKFLPTLSPCCCQDDVFSSAPETVANSGGGETITVEFCGVDAGTVQSGSIESRAIELVEQLNTNKVGILDGTFSYDEDFAIIYTGCACEDTVFTFGGTSG